MSIGRFRSQEGRVAYETAYKAAMATMPAPSASHDLPTSFGTVRAYEWSRPGEQGSDDLSRPVVLFPGRSSGTPMWADNLPDLLQRRRVIAFDAIGDAGMSEQSRPLTSKDQAVWVDEALGALSVVSAHTLGHSFGGATAAIHALRRPSRVASLSLLEPVFTLAWPPPSVFGWATLLLLPGPGWVHDRALAALGGVDVADVQARTPVGEMIGAAAEHFIAALPTPRAMTNDQITRLTMPVYVALAASRSLAGGRRAAARAEQIPGGQVKVWPDTTHSLPMQVSTALDAELLTFWDDVDANRALG